MNTQEIVISSKDAVLLSALVRRAELFTQTDDAVEELGTALEFARVIDSARMLRAVVGLGTTVDYVEVPEGALRTVTLAHPTEADMSRGRISVLSPVERALLGRKTGHVLDISLPSGRRQRVKVMGVRRDGAQGGGDD